MGAKTTQNGACVAWHVSTRITEHILPHEQERLTNWTCRPQPAPPPMNIQPPAVLSARARDALPDYLTDNVLLCGAAVTRGR